jgi:hypothetical protein
MGLPEDAYAFLKEHEKHPDPCPHCGRGYPPQTEEIGTYMGMFSDTYSLRRHFLKDGRTADEFLQAEPWSSGPCFFLGLKVSDGTTFEWPQESIENA